MYWYQKIHDAVHSGFVYFILCMKCLNLKNRYKERKKWNSVKICVSEHLVLLLKTFKWFCNYIEMKTKILTISYKAHNYGLISSSIISLSPSKPHSILLFPLMNYIFFFKAYTLKCCPVCLKNSFPHLVLFFVVVPSLKMFHQMN